MHKKSYNSNCSMIFLGIKCPNDTTNPTSNCPLTHFGGHLCNGNFCSSEYNFTGFALPLIVVTTSNLFSKVPFLLKVFVKYTFCSKSILLTILVLKVLM
jgi:hypothetical protein